MTAADPGVGYPRAHRDGRAAERRDVVRLDRHLPRVAAGVAGAAAPAGRAPVAALRTGGARGLGGGGARGVELRGGLPRGARAFGAGRPGAAHAPAVRGGRPRVARRRPARRPGGDGGGVSRPRRGGGVPRLPRFAQRHVRQRRVFAGRRVGRGAAGLPDGSVGHLVHRLAGSRRAGRGVARARGPGVARRRDRAGRRAARRRPAVRRRAAGDGADGEGDGAGGPRGGRHLRPPVRAPGGRGAGGGARLRAPRRRVGRTGRAVRRAAREVRRHRAGSTPPGRRKHCRRRPAGTA